MFFVVDHQIIDLVVYNDVLLTQVFVRVLLYLMDFYLNIFLHQYFVQHLNVKSNYTFEKHIPNDYDDNLLDLFLLMLKLFFLES